MTLNVTDHPIAISPAPPSIPRLRLQPTGVQHTVLDGGWWPRSTDPVAELPGLVVAIDALRGPVTQLMLHVHDWDSHPGRLAVAGRVVRLGYVASQPAGLLTALCGKHNIRMNLVVVPPDAASRVTEAATILAATATNQIHAPDSIRPVNAHQPGPTLTAQTDT